MLVQDVNPEIMKQFDSFGTKQSDAGITFDEFVNSEFSYKTFNGSWSDTNELRWMNKVNT